MIAPVVVHHRVTIAGKVVDAATREAIAGAEVVILEMPPELKQRLQYRAAAQLVKTRTRNDGLFYFMDLPEGKYTLSASLPRFAQRYGRAQIKVKASRDDAGDTRMQFVNLALQPTSVKGKITGPGHKTGLMMAQVQIKGSGERTFSNGDGEYVLSGIEAGKRTLQVLAQGYRPASEQVLIAAGEVKAKDFDLQKDGGR